MCVVNLFIENNSVVLKFCRALLFRVLILCLEHFGCTFTYYKNFDISQAKKNRSSYRVFNIF